MALLPPDIDAGLTYPKKDERDEISEFTMEIRDVSPSHLLIKIASFSLLEEHGIQKYESREFAAGGYKWRLIIYLNKDDISVNLVMAGTNSLSPDWEVNAIFSIFLFNQILDNYLCFRGKMRRFHAIKSEWGLSKFISKKSLTDPSNGYLVNDNCVLGAEVFVIKSERVIEYLSVLKVEDQFKRDWKISNFSKLEGIWTSEEFTAGGHKWKVVLYPNGLGREKGRSVSIFLESVDSKGFAPHKKLKAKFCMRMKNQLNDDHYSVNLSNWFTSSVVDWGLFTFIPISDMHPSKGFIVNDCCILETEISVQIVAQDAP